MTDWGPDERTRAFARVGAAVLERMGIHQASPAPSQVGGTIASGRADLVVVDFVVGHVAADLAAAEWIAWHLEELGFAVDLEEWAPEADLDVQSDSALARAQLPVVVVGEAYARRQSALAALMAHSDEVVLIQVAPGILDEVYPEARYAHIARQDERTTRYLISEAVAGRGTLRPRDDSLTMVRLTATQRQRIVDVLVRDQHIEAQLARRFVDDPLLADQAVLPTSPAALYASVLNILEALTEAGSIFIGRGKPDSMTVVGWINHFDPRASYSGVDPDGIMGRAARGKRAVWVPDVALEPDYVKASAQTRSELALPLIEPRTNASMGVLNIEWDRLSAASLDELRWLRLFNRRVSAALESALDSRPWV